MVTAHGEEGQYRTLSRVHSGVVKRPVLVYVCYQCNCCAEAHPRTLKSSHFSPHSEFVCPKTWENRHLLMCFHPFNASVFQTHVLVKSYI